MLQKSVTSALALLLAASQAYAAPQPRLSERDAPLYERDSATNKTTIKTKVVVLGAGMSGTIAARTLALDKGLTDFVIVEARGEIGGRMQTQQIGNNLTVERGPNWVQGTADPATGAINPLWALRNKYNLSTYPTDAGDVTYYDDTGLQNYSTQYNTFNDAYTPYLATAGARQSNNQVDLTARNGWSLSGWKPKDYVDRAVEYYLYDTEYAEPPEVSSWIQSSNNYNYTFNNWTATNDFVIDPRGFKILAQNEANRFLKPNDPRLLLNHPVTKIAYTDNGVTVYTANGTVIQADYAICTFSVGVLQHDDVTFEPALPDWKMESIFGFSMTTYTKIFMTFPTKFWADTQFALYADKHVRGWFVDWQNLDHPNFLPGSKTIFATLRYDLSVFAESLPDSAIAEEGMKVLRSMYGSNIPNMTNIYFPRWLSDPLFRGSYSNWGTSYLVEDQDNLRAPVGRLWFAGEATSFKYYGFLHGAYYEGMNAGSLIAVCLQTPSKCTGEDYFPALYNAQQKGIKAT